MRVHIKGFPFNWAVPFVSSSFSPPPFTMCRRQDIEEKKCLGRESFLQGSSLTSFDMSWLYERVICNASLQHRSAKRSRRQCFQSELNVGPPGGRGIARYATRLFCVDPPMLFGIVYTSEITKTNQGQTARSFKNLQVF